MKKTIFALVGIIALAVVLLWQNSAQTVAQSTIPEKYENASVATFAGGCFWCIEAGFEKVPGVKEAISGFSGGKEKNPSYYDVAFGRTGHTEAVQIYYDPKVITYDGLLQAFWRMMDPTDKDGQFNDRGEHYRPAIFYHDSLQNEQAEKSKAALDKDGPFKRPVVIDIEPYRSFYPAEEEHQNYSSKNPLRYVFYTRGSGRAGFVENTWGKDLKVDFAKYRPMEDKVAISSGDKSVASNEDEAEISMAQYKKPSTDQITQMLTPLQFEVTQEEGTERPFDNEYWDEKRDGIYVDIVSGEPLFSSKDKFKSGTGWPSFTRSIEGVEIVEKKDRKFFATRIEVRSPVADSHLGHLFDDGPAPTGNRYCVNSASLRFIPSHELETKGYGKFASMFKKKGM